MIQHKTARKLLYSWHGGQWSHSYAAASSGMVRCMPSLISELRLNLNDLDNGTLNGENFRLKDKIELSKLISYLEHKRKKYKEVNGLPVWFLNWYNKQ